MSLGAKNERHATNSIYHSVSSHTIILDGTQWVKTRFEDIRLLSPLRYFLLEPFLSVVLGFLCILPFAVLLRRALLVIYLIVFSVAYHGFSVEPSSTNLLCFNGYCGSPPYPQSEQIGLGGMARGRLYYVYDPKTHPNGPNMTNPSIYLVLVRR